MELRIGTSGWHYPGGRGTWTGIFYPRPEDRPKGFDELGFYAERFNTVEVNSTFYGQPRATVSLAWVRRTPPAFEFTVKLFQKFTHPATAMDRSAVTRADVDAFKAGIEPLAVAGRLGALLAQFPSRFHDTPESRAYLDWLLGTFSAYPLAVEFRHRSWSDDRPATQALLAAHDAAWVLIDEPKFASSVRQDLTPNSPTLMYVRLHGRNAADWWTHEEAEDRYNYLYPESELAPIVDRLRAARAQVRKLYLYLNNHFAAQAVANATMVRSMLDDPVTARMPAELVAAYPMLEGRVAILPPARLL
ncbi:MAG: DUF72 domain-containing protein [Acidobacteriota bacterium]|nr:DUF72 domain-containing protein [Acidobacteriota bacterium]